MSRNMEKSLVKIRVFIAFIFITLFTVKSNAQYTTTVQSEDGYSVTVEILLAAVEVKSNSCEWGYNYVIEVEYNIVFTGDNIPNKLYTLQIESLVDNKGNDHGLNMKTKAGQYSGTTYRTWTNDKDCSTISIENLGFKDMNIIIHGPGINNSSIVVPPNSGLPVDLLCFKASKQSDRVNIAWSTASELNNDFFSVERSSDNEYWEELTTTLGAGNSNLILKYEYTDEMPLKGVSYYRLKQTDYDGKFTYSQTVTVNLSEKASGKLNVFPNPTSDIIYVDVDASEIQDVRVFNMLGQDITADVNMTYNGDSQYRLSLSNMPVGIYIIKNANASIKVYKQ